MLFEAGNNTNSALSDNDPKICHDFLKKNRLAVSTNCAGLILCSLANK